MSITSVATNNTPPTVVASPYRRVGEDNDSEDLPQVAVKEKRMLPNQVPGETPKNITGNGPNEATWEKRYGDLRRHEQKKTKELQDQINALNTQLLAKNAKEQVNNLPKTAEEVKAWAEAYPESFDMIKTVAVTETQVQLDELRAQIANLQTDNEKTSQEKAEAVLTTLVPTWRELNKSMDFHEWLGKPSRKTWAQTVYHSSDPEAIAEILNTYLERNKETTPAPKKNTNNNVDAALNVNTRNNPEVGLENNQEGYIKESDIKKLTRKQFEEYEEVIDKARRENRFIYDVTGKAQ